MQGLFYSSAFAALVIVPSGMPTYFGAAPGAGNSLEIDMDGNGVADIRLVAGTDVGSSGAFSLAANAIGPSSAILALPPVFAGDLGSEAYPAPFGVIMDPSRPPFASYQADWFVDDVFTVENPGNGFPGSGPVEFRTGSVLYGVTDRGIVGAPPAVSGAWRPGQRQALGIRFSDTAGNLHYGWIDITLQSAFGLQIHGWAYESDPDVFVSASAIPETSAFALIVGSCATAMLRRRRC